MVERNKDSLFPSAAFLLLVNLFQRKHRQKNKINYYKTFASYLLFRKKNPKQTNLSITLMIEVMMIPHLHRKNPSTFDSENSRTIKDMKKYFQASRKRLISFIFCENPNSQKLPTFNSKVYFTKRPTNKKKLSLVKSQL